MSKYSDLDSHSRNCSSCIRQRDSTAGKKYSAPCRKLTESGTKLRRSVSSLSSADIAKEDNQESTTYQTPTQRKNNEIKRLKAELNKASDLIQAKDREIICLRNELVKYKGGVSPDNCEATSIPDSGNCEDPDSEQEPETRSVLQNIDFELMETTLQEEEETRQQLTVENHRLTVENERLRLEQKQFGEQLIQLAASHEDQVLNLKESFEVERDRMKAKHNTRVGEILEELADSSLRYSKQQESIDNKQGKIEDQSRRIEELNSQLCQLKTDSAAMNKYQTNLEQTISNLKQDLSGQNNSSEACSPGEMAKLEAQLESSNLIITTLQSQINKRISDSSETKYLTRPDLEDRSVQTVAPLLLDKVNQADFWQEYLADNRGARTVPSDAKGSDIAVTYEFLRRSIYYFLTDKENKAYHLKCIERLLQFTEGEKQIIDQHKPLKKY